MPDNACIAVTRYYDGNKPLNGLAVPYPLKSGQRGIGELRARHALWIIEHAAPATIIAMQTQLPELWARFVMDDLRAFAAANKGI